MASGRIVIGMIYLLFWLLLQMGVGGAGGFINPLIILNKTF